MKRFGKIAGCLAVGLALNASLHADNLAVANNPLPDNPYAPVAVRNVFGLVSPVVVTNDPQADIAASLPKITPTGIMGVFGDWQVLFKVGSAAKPGSPPVKDEFYILSQGQRQDGIEVLDIDEKKGLVTFDNNGTTQKLPLISTPSSGASAVSSSSGGGTNPGMVPGRPGGGGNNGGITRFGGGALGGRNGNTANANSGFNNSNPGNGANNGMDFGSSTQGSIYQPEPTTMTPEESQIILAAHHLQAIQANDPTAPLFPASKIDREAGIAPPDGSPAQ